jgi:hypothetical protein
MLARTQTSPLEPPLLRSPPAHQRDGWRWAATAGYRACWHSSRPARPHPTESWSSECMAESAGLAHPSISSLRPTMANEVLYDGRATEVTSGRDCRLRVVARWLPSQGVRWTAHFPEPGPKAWSAAAEVRFRLKARGAYSGQEVVGQARDSASGWMDGAEVVGRTEAAVPAVLVRWVNLGNVGQGNWLEAVAGDGTRRRWAGRGVWRVGEWTMAVDARPDLRAVIETLKDTGKYAVTHLGCSTGSIRGHSLPRNVSPS